MPRTQEQQRTRARERYGRYRLACRALGIDHQGSRWSSHIGQLELEHGPHKITAMIVEYVERARAEAIADGTSREGQPDYFGVWCITCRKDCLPLDDQGGICGFCGRVPSTGVYADSDENRRATWRDAKRRQRQRVAA